VGFIDDATQLLAGRSPQELERLEADPGALAMFFGLSPANAGINIFDEAEPDYAWEAGNTAAASGLSLPFIICGEECVYRRGFSSNPFYRGLDLSGCLRRHGCAFCLRPATTPKWAHDPVSLFRRQLDALGRTHRPWKEPLAVRAVGSPVMRHIERVCKVLAGFCAGPVHLLVDGRADAVVRGAERIEAAVGRLADTPHALHFCLMGVESFVGEELLRFNKGLDWRDNFDATHILLSLEESHPGHFGFSTWGGLSLILFSPWTRMHDLALNLAVVRRARILDLCGKVFTSRLRLYRPLPLYPMAVRDGLVQDSYSDPMLDTARRNFYADEVPWRFAAPGMEEISRLLIRFAGEKPQVGDPLSDMLFRYGIYALTPEERLALAERLVDAAIEHPHAEAKTLLARAMKLCNLHGGAKAAVAVPESFQGALRNEQWGKATEPCTMKAPGPAYPRQVCTPARDDLGLTPSELLLLAFDLGLKPVVRLEEPERDLGVAFEAELASRAPCVRLRRRNADGGVEAFVGTTTHEVEEAIHLTDRMDKASDDEEWRRMARRVGALLGYPPCCVEAFVARPPSVRENYMWLHVRLRLDEPGEVPHVLNPAIDNLVGHVPCSLLCEATRVRVERLLSALRGRLGAQGLCALEERMRQPWLLFFDTQGAAVELIGSNPAEGPLVEGGTYRYRAGMFRGDEPLVQRVVQGDSLVIQEQHLLVMRQGALCAALSGRAFVWWYRRAFQVDFLRRLYDLRFAARNERLGVRKSEGAACTQGEAARLIAFLSSVLRLGRGDAPSFFGFSPTRVEAVGSGRVCLTLTSSHDVMRLHISRRGPKEGSYAAFGAFGIYHRREEPVDSAEKDAAIRSLAAYLQRAVELMATARQGGGRGRR